MGFVLLSLPNISALVYRNTTDFCILILYLFIGSNGFWVETVEFSIGSTISSANSYGVNSSFPICIHLISFSYDSCG